MLTATAAALGVDPSVLVVIAAHVILLIAHKLGYNPLSVPLPVVPSPGPTPTPGGPTGRPILDLLARLFGGGGAVAPPAPAPQHLSSLTVPDLVKARDQLHDELAARASELAAHAPEVLPPVPPG